jgi:hypothetical protein
VSAPWKSTLEGQYLAAIDMLENAIKACTPPIWDDRSAPIARRFWYLAYHTIFWLDRYESPSPDAHVPPEPFTLGELDPSGVYPDRTYTVKELLDYLELARARCREAIDRLDEARASQQSTIRSELSVLEMHHYSLRHVQHHAAQLNLLLRQGGAEPPRWVARGRGAR